jgi:hypothetical protein
MNQKDILPSNEHREFLRAEELYLSDYIKFADQKAAFLFAFTLATLGFLFSHEQYSDLFRLGLKVWGLDHPFCLLSSFLLLLALVASMLVFTPRLTSSPKSLIYWEGVAQFKDEVEYKRAIEALSSDGISQQVARHCWELATIATAKYRFLKIAFWTAPFGGVLGVFLSVIR